MDEPQKDTESVAWQEYRDELFRFILKRVRNHAAAEDIVQEVLVKAYARQGTLKDVARLRPWLYQITRNAIIDHYRMQKPSAAIPSELIHEETDGETDRARWELARCLVPLIDELAGPYREALKLTELESLTQQEAASRLGISLSGAKSRVQRGRKLLRELLLKCCQVEVDRRGDIVDYQVGEGCDACADRRNTQVKASLSINCRP